MATKIPDTLSRMAVPLDELTPYERNPRQGDVGAIAASLERNGQYRPIVARKGTGEILAGNHTFWAAKQLGWERIAVTWVECTDEQARRIVLADNRTNDLASYDEPVLADLLREIVDEEGEDGLLGTGFDSDYLDDLLVDLGQVPQLDEDEAPELPEEAVTQPGDVWQLGPHRLICGSATEPEVLAELMRGERATMMWTDPPYGVEYVGKTEDALTIRNDSADGLEGLLRDAFAAADAVLEPGAAVYVAHPAGKLSLTFGIRFVEQGWRLHQTLVWVKNTPVVGRSDYHYQHEPLLFGTTAGGEHLEPDRAELDGEHVPIFYGYTQGGGRRGRGSEHWWGGNAQSTVIYAPKPRRSKEHPTMKPVALIDVALRNSSRRGHLVLDPFAGSGSTVIAAHGLGRIARAVELDPRYCDVICRRFQEYTGEVPVREGDGPHDFTA